MRNYILILYLALFSFLAKGQETQQTVKIPQIFAPAPTASELGKYGTYPVNLSTGLPQIEIPLYTIQSGDIQIPITLKYHASGIKVNQEASWVGLGWSLDAGGSISREIRGRPDEEGGYRQSIEQNPHMNAQWVHNYMKTADPDNSVLNNLTNETGGYSFHPDLYHMSLPTVNGQYFINEEEAPVVFPPQPIKIENFNGISSGLPKPGIKVIDPNGMEYYLTEGDTTFMRNVEHDPFGEFTSSWNLAKMKSTTTQKEILFSYQQDGVLDLGNISNESRSIIKTRCDDFPNEEIKREVNCTDGTLIDGIKSLKSLNSMTTYKISEINFEQGRVRFVMGNQRDDILSTESSTRPSSLHKILIESKNNDGTFTLVKGYGFDYSYFTTYSSGYPSNGKRLRLEHVFEFDAEGPGTKTLAEFEYSSVALPVKGSFSQDYWGYYNGEENNHSLIPPVVVSTYLPVGGNNTVTGTSNREINPLKIEAGILKKIYHPTKGYTLFHYEPNTFFGKSFYSNTYHAKTLHGGLQGEGLADETPEECDSPTQRMITEEPSCEDNPLIPKTTYVDYDLANKVTATISYQIIDSAELEDVNKYSFGEITGPDGFFISGRSKSGSVEVPLEGVGTFDIRAYGENIYVSLSIRYNEYVEETEKNQLVGGLRIKSIQNYDYDNTLIKEKKYQYHFTEGGVEKSSGFLTSKFKPLYSSGSTTNYTAKTYSCGAYSTCCGYQEDETKTILSNAVVGISSNSVIYNKVREIEKGENQELITDNEFIVSQDFEYSVSEPSLNRSTTRGQLSNQKIYKTLDNNTHVLLQETQNTYSKQSNPQQSIIGLKVQKNAQLTGVCTGVAPSWSERINPVDYIFTQEWYTKDQSKSTQYFYTDSGALQNTITSQTDYTYGNPSHQQVTKTTVSNSKGETIESSYQYAHEKNDTRMITENRIGIPLQTTVKKGSATLSDQLTKYNTFGELYLPQFIFSKKGASVTQTATDRRLTHDRYDAQGNLLQYHTEDGLYTSILWGYNGQYPIAKVEGATYDQISGYATNINGLRTALPNAMVTTYTYEPLVGVTSITAPNGQIQTFTYDEFHRLYQVKDHTGKILKEYEYHYQTQNN